MPDYTRAEKLYLELRARVIQFCTEQDWADEKWKSQPHVAALFEATGPEWDLTEENS